MKFKYFTKLTRAALVGLAALGFVSLASAEIVNVTPQPVTITKLGTFDMSTQKLATPEATNHLVTAPESTFANAFKNPGNAKSKPDFVKSFAGENVYNNLQTPDRTTTPPDQALCVGNGYVVERINDTIRIYDTHGRALTQPLDTNTFNLLPPSTLNGFLYGPDADDAVCLYDKDSNRFYTINVTGNRYGFPSSQMGLLNPHHDAEILAVSQTGDPTGKWDVYKIPVDNNGLNGTPLIPCSTPTHPEYTCTLDYTKMGIDKNGVYLSGGSISGVALDNFDLVSLIQNPSAIIYAMPKRSFIKGDAVTTGWVYDGRQVAFDPNTDPVGSVFPPGKKPYYLFFPATAAGNAFSSEQGGTEYLVGMTDNNPLYGVPEPSNVIAIIALSNTQSLNGPHPDLKVSKDYVSVDTYIQPDAFSANVPQKNAINMPLRDCLNDSGAAKTSGWITNPSINFCWQYFFSSEPAHNEVVPMLSTYAPQAWLTYANGKLWIASVSFVIVDNQTLFGSAYYILQPKMDEKTGVHADILKQGQIGVKDVHLVYPNIAVTDSGKGVISFLLSGENFFPSSAYVPIDAKIGAGDVTLVKEGLSALDDFSGYLAFNGGFQSPARSGDYTMATVDGNDIWIATESIEQTCTLQEYLAEVPTDITALYGPNASLTHSQHQQYATCGHTRGSRSNYSTRITKLRMN